MFDTGLIILLNFACLPLSLQSIEISFNDIVHCIEDIRATLTRELRDVRLKLR